MCGDDVGLACPHPKVKSVCASSQSVPKTSQTLAISLEAGYNNSMDIQRPLRVKLFDFLRFLVFSLFHNLWKTQKVKKFNF